MSDGLRYDPQWIRAQSDDDLLREIQNLSDFDYAISSVSWIERVEAVNQIARELRAMRAQRALVEEHGWPAQKMRVVK